MTKDKYAQPWGEFAQRWQRYYTPPGRPSEQAIKVYREFIRKSLKDLNRQPRVLILGATPELRDLVREFQAEITIIDSSLEMILAMSELLEKKNPEEIIVRADWLNSPLRDNYWDLAVGDLVISNIPREKQDQFLREVKRLLKPRGYFITKIEVVPNDWQKGEFDQVLEKYTQAPLGKNRPMELVCHLHLDAWDSKTEIASLAKIKEWMEKYKASEGKYKYPDRKISQYLNDIWEMWKPMKKEWSFKYERDVARQLSSYFHIIEKRILSDCYFSELDQGFPIWLNQVK